MSTTLQSYVAGRFVGSQADISVVGFNLFGVQHREHPFGQLLDRRVMALLTYRF